MKIKEVCARTGLTERAVRLYLEKGLLSPESCWRQGRTYREYGEEDVARLQEISALRSVGFSLEEIGALQRDGAQTNLLLQKRRTELREDAAAAEETARLLDGLPLSGWKDGGEPEKFNVEKYMLFQGIPSIILSDHDIIDVGDRRIEVFHTPGHSPGHMCFWEQERGYLFTGDLAYKGTLYADYPSTDPEAYLISIEKVADLPVKKLFPAHHSLDIQPEILFRIREEFNKLKREGRLCHGSGTFEYGDWAAVF